MKAECCLCFHVWKRSLSGKQKAGLSRGNTSFTFIAIYIKGKVYFMFEVAGYASGCLFCQFVLVQLVKQ